MIETEIQGNGGKRSDMLQVPKVTSNKIETVTQHLEQRIQAGEWKVNQSLPQQSALAREYGVSLGSISLAFRNLQQRGLLVIVPNRGAYVLGTTAVDNQEVYPQIALRGSYVRLNMYAGSGLLVAGVVDTANEKHCPLLLLPRPKGDRDYDLQYYRARSVQGVVYLGSESYPEALNLHKSGFPVILCNRPVAGTTLNYIDYDHATALKQIMNRLVDLGHERIAVISRVQPNNFWQSLYPDYLEVLASRGKLHNRIAEYWQYVDMEEQGSDARVVDRLMGLQETPTALFIQNPGIAQNVIRELQRRGLKVPDDLSVVSSCNSSEAHLGISGFVLPVHQLGMELFYELHETIKNPFHSVQRLLPLSYVDRGTVIPPRQER